jgi:hypothetical protein
MRRNELPTVDVEAIVAPDRLSEESRRLWGLFLADLVGIYGGVADGDRILLEDVLRARDRLEEIQMKLAEDGPTVTGSRGQTRPHPLLATERALRRDVAVGFARLGLTERHWSHKVQADGRIRHDRGY